jgi:SAM-dependent methyltransferase
MYVQVLSGALETWSGDLTDDDLLQYVRALRAKLPVRDLGAGIWSAEALAVEVAYDCALINLAAVHGIDVSPRHFAHPKISRIRLEASIASIGIDLDAPPEQPRRAEPED